MSRPARLVQRIHFEDFGGSQFERLVFAYLLRAEKWHELAWYGQGGDDGGRDLWGTRDKGTSDGEKTCVQCANWTRLSAKKGKEDIDKVIFGEKGLPDGFLIVSGGTVPARTRDSIKKYAEYRGIRSCEIWSGPEFEERLRRDTESLLKRFVDGRIFPDTTEELRDFVSSLEVTKDEDILRAMSSIFDRPAFYTPFQSESSLPDFNKAITDTIESLNTGIHRLRDGTEIERFPSRHKITDEKTRNSLAEIERQLAYLRSRYELFVEQGKIKICACGRPNCSILFTKSPVVIHEMNRLRSDILRSFRGIYPKFSVTMGLEYRHMSVEPPLREGNEA
jgi:hypothetical protein